MDTYVSILTWLTENPDRVLTMLVHMRTVLFLVIWLKIVHNQVRKRGAFGRYVEENSYWTSAGIAYTLCDSLDMVSFLFVATAVMIAIYYVIRPIMPAVDRALEVLVNRLEMPRRSSIRV